MRILYCNKYNYPFSGTEVYLFELMELMRSQGHEVALFSMADPRGEPTPYDQHFRSAHRLQGEGGTGGRRRGRPDMRSIRTEARRRIRAMIEEFRPDVAHVRNIYHHLSPSILWELKAQNVPVLYHLNDFKLLCPSYNLVSQGEACEACKGGAFWHALQPGCYPGMGARLTLTAEAYVHRWLGTYRKCVDLFLAPSQFVRDKFVEHGWDGDKFEVLPHFQQIHRVEGAAGQMNGGSCTSEDCRRRRASMILLRVDATSSADAIGRCRRRTAARRIAGIGGCPRLIERGVRRTGGARGTRLSDRQVAVHGAALARLRDAGQDDSGVVRGGAGGRGVGSGIAAGTGSRRARRDFCIERAT